MRGEGREEGELMMLEFMMSGVVGVKNEAI